MKSKMTWIRIQGFPAIIKDFASMYMGDPTMHLMSFPGDGIVLHITGDGESFWVIVLNQAGSQIIDILDPVTSEKLAKRKAREYMNETLKEGDDEEGPADFSDDVPDS